MPSDAGLFSENTFEIVQSQKFFYKKKTTKSMHMGHGMIGGGGGEG
jgi:hypothetical protein